MSKQEINDERLNSHNQLIYLTLITKLAKSNWKRSQILAELLPRWGERGIGLSLPGSPREERETEQNQCGNPPGTCFPPPPSLQL